MVGDAVIGLDEGAVGSEVGSLVTGISVGSAVGFNEGVCVGLDDGAMEFNTI